MLVQIFVGSLFLVSGLFMINNHNQQSQRGQVIYIIGGMLTGAGAWLLFDCVIHPEDAQTIAKLKAAL